MTSAAHTGSLALKQSIKDEARRLGFILAGVTTPDPPPHASIFENWISQGLHATMGYLAETRSRSLRSNPRLIMADCKSIVVLAIPYANPGRVPETSGANKMGSVVGRTAAYAWGADYHRVLPERLEAIVLFIENELGHPVSSRAYTDSGPVLERDLAQRAGLGWIGKNTCLINPKGGSYVLLAEIFLDVELEPDAPFRADHCGTCARCVEACPTACILPDRTLDSSRCISYLTIELRDEIASNLRPLMGNWVFGCDICQMVCPWNRFAPPIGDVTFGDHDPLAQADLTVELGIGSEDFRGRFKETPVSRAKHAGYRRNIAVALGNGAGSEASPALQVAADDEQPLVAEHATWALERVRARQESHV